MPITTAAGLADSTVEYITAMKNKANEEITRLDGFADSWTFGSPATEKTIATISGAYTTLAAITAAATVTLDTLTAYSAWTAAPTLVTAPTLSSYTTPQWSETFWTNLKNGIDNFTGTVTNQTTLAGAGGMLAQLTSDTDKIQVAFYAEDLQRKQQVLRDLYSAANSQTANKGFLFPTSMTTALKLDAQQKFQFDLSQTSRDLIKFLMEWAKSNWQFTVGQSISAHNSDIDFNTRYCDVLLKSYATTINAELDKFKAQVSQEIEKARTNVLEFQAKVDALIKKYTVETAAVQKVDELELKLDEVKISALSAHDKAAVDAWAAWASNAMRASEINVQAMQGQTNAKINAAAQALQGATTVASSATQVALGILS